MRTFFNHFISLLLCSIAPVLLCLIYGLVLSVGSSNWIRVFGELYILAFFVFIFSAMHTFLLGLPTYFLVRRILPFNYLVSAFSGFVVGIIPVAIYAWPLSSSGSSTINGTPTIINGIPTIAGWISYGQGVLAFGVLGISGAITYKYLLTRLQSTDNALNADAKNDAG
ncbi:hypothetical protein [Alishewanella tabrizica]|uniref:hypothetical protein n=1 Tax=Alishewanella tabrizica TaxID=671278 RepID=UPI0016735FF2|nr:hypothetical protein [Alishewanella tabrizica]